MGPGAGEPRPAVRPGVRGGRRRRGQAARRGALGAGADVVVTGRVTDASLVVGPAAWWHGWERTDWDPLAADWAAAAATTQALAHLAGRTVETASATVELGPSRRGR